MPFDVLVTCANPLLNLVHEGGFLPGEVNRVEAMFMAAEGKGVNVARVLASFGHRVVLTGFAGGHGGAWLRDLVRSQGVVDALVETAAPLRLGFMAFGSEGGHPTTVLPKGFEVTPAECSSLLERADSLLDSVRLVIASGSTPNPAADDLYADLLALCHSRSKPCWLDAYGMAMTRALAGPFAPKLAKPNRQEYEQSASWDRVDELHVTDGGGPVLVESREEGRWRVLPPLIGEINPIGSGDCYLAGLAHAWLRGLPLDERLRFAAAAGTANAFKRAVAAIFPEEVLALLDRVEVERIRPAAMPPD